MFLYHRDLRDVSFNIQINLRRFATISTLLVLRITLRPYDTRLQIHPTLIHCDVKLLYAMTTTILALSIQLIPTTYTFREEWVTGAWIVRISLNIKIRQRDGLLLGRTAQIKAIRSIENEIIELLVGI